MIKTEANFSLKFRSWLRANYKCFDSCSFEVKDTRGKSYFSLKELKEEQINHALANKSPKGNLIRNSAGTIGAADYFFYRNAYAYIVINYPKSFFIIDIDDIILEKTKSLKFERAREIAIKEICKD